MTGTPIPLLRYDSIGIIRNKFVPPNCVPVTLSFAIVRELNRAILESLFFLFKPSYMMRLPGILKVTSPVIKSDEKEMQTEARPD